VNDKKDPGGRIYMVKVMVFWNNLLLSDV